MGSEPVEFTPRGLFNAYSFYGRKVFSSMPLTFCVLLDPVEVKVGFNFWKLALSAGDERYPCLENLLLKGRRFG